jgi:hypothetical protein
LSGGDRKQVKAAYFKIRIYNGCYKKIIIKIIYNGFNNRTVINFLICSNGFFKKTVTKGYPAEISEKARISVTIF